MSEQDRRHAGRHTAADDASNAASFMAGVAGAGAPSDTPAVGGTSDESGLAPASADAAAARQVVFIDGNVPDARLLAAGVAPGVQAVILNPNQNGIQQIAAWLTSHGAQNLAGIDIVTHGADGVIDLSNSPLDSATIGQYQNELATIGAALQPGGAVQLYGCDVAGDAAGDAFLQQLSDATGGASVAASSNLVGSAAEGGSWTLNVDVGQVTAGDPFTAATQAAYPDVLSGVGSTDKIIFVSSNSESGAAAVGTRVEQISAQGTAFVSGSTVDFVNGVTSGQNGLTDSTFGLAADTALNEYFVTADNSSTHALTIQKGTPAAAGSTLTTFYTVPFQDLTGSSSTMAILGQLAINPVAGELYYALTAFDSNGDVPADTGIFEMNVSGTTAPTLLTSASNTLFNPLAVALDVQDNLLFFTDAYASTESSTGAAGSAGPLASVNELYVANLNTGSITLLHNFTTQEVDPDFLLQGLAVDPVNHEIYLTSVGDFETNTSSSNSIYKIPFTVSGSGNSASASIGVISTLYSGAGAFQPNDIAIDVAQGIFYTGGGSVVSSNDTVGAVFEGSLSGGSSLTVVEPLTSIVSSDTSAAVGDIIPQLDVLTAPVVSGGTTVSAVTGGGSVIADSGLTVTEPDGQLLTGATVSGVLTGDTLSFNGGASKTFADGFTISSGFSGGTLTLSGNASAADYNSALDAVTFASNSTTATPRTLDWAVSDADFTSAISTSTVLVRVAPTVTAGASPTFDGGGASVDLDAGLTVTDASNTTLVSATVADSGFITGDTLTVGSLGGLGSVFSGGTLTLSGTASLSVYQTALESVKFGFSPGNGDPTGGGSHTSRTFDWVVNDGALSSSPVTSTLTVVHEPPTFNAGGTVTFDGGGVAVVLDSTLSASDADSGGNFTGGTVAISGTVAGDTLNFTAQNGISISSNSNGTLILTGTASIANYETALQSVTYGFTAGGDPTGGGTHTSRTINWKVTDGNSSNGVSNTGSSTLDTVHVAPTVTAGGTVTFDAGGSPVTLDSGATATDPDSGGDLASATVAISGGFLSGDTLTVGAPGALVTSFASGTLTLTGTASLGTYDAALDSVAYKSTAADPTNGGADDTRAITWKVNDGVSASATASSAVNVVAAQPPTITAAGTVTFDGGGAAVALDSSASATSSGGSLVSATIAINSGFIVGDTLTVGLLGGLGSSFSNGTLTLTGSASVATYDAALDSVDYGFSAGGDPTDGGSDTSRGISWAVTDGVTSSATASSRINIVHVGPTVTAGATVTFTGGGPPVALDPTASATDPDSGGDLISATVAINSGFVTGDTLTVGSPGALGSVFSNGTLTLTGTAPIATYDAALDSVDYGFTAGGDPTDGGTDSTRGIAWTVNDGVSASAIASSGVNIEHASPTVTASGTVTYEGGDGAVTLDPGASVSDPDSGGVLVGATISIDSGFIGGDTLTVGDRGALGSVFSNGTLTLTGTASFATYDTALASVAYNFAGGGDPTDGGTDTSRGISWTVDDGVFSSEAATSSVDVVHTAPTVNATGTVTFEGGGTAVALDATASVSDPDSGGNLASATVTINSGFLTGDTLTVGTLSGLGSVFSNGTLTLTGTASFATYDAALDSIDYNFDGGGDPTDGGADTSRGISWTVNDGVSDSATDTSTVVVVRPAPTVNAAGTVTFDGGGSPVALDPTASTSDVGSGGTLTSATVAINSGFVTGDTLTVGALGGLGSTFSNGTLTLTGTASTSVYDAALDSVDYGFTAGGDPTNGGADTTRGISWNVSDGVSASATDTSTLDVVHTPPTVTASGSVNYRENALPVVLDGSLTASDPDSGGDLTGATVVIANGFISGDQLNFTDQSGIGGGFSGNTLTLTGSATIGDYQAALRSIIYDFTAGDPTDGGADTSRTIDWTVSDAVSASAVSSSALTTSVCFCPGTAIKTSKGEVGVERLEVGDLVVTLDGDQRVLSPVKWIGRRRLDLTAHPRPEAVAPLCIHCGAFAENVPHRDLFLSPDHALFIEGKLIPARLLINDMTIARQLDTRAVTYYHVELDRHAVLFAEGMPAESYLDAGDRVFFSNGGAVLTLHPELKMNASGCWETRACAPLELRPAAVEALCRRLVERANSLGFSVLTALKEDAASPAAPRASSRRPAATGGARDPCLLPNRDGSANLRLSRVEAA